MEENKMNSATIVEDISRHEVKADLEAQLSERPLVPDLTEEEKIMDDKILRKIDLVAGFQKDNHLSGVQYSTVVSLFYVGYIVLQPISGVAIRFVETYLLLGLANITWGLFTIMLLFSKSITLPSILRVCIGAAEGLVQINNVFLTMWYTQHEIATRTGIWYSSGVLAGTFTGLIAFGIQKHHTSSLKPWQLLFLIEGILPIIFGPILMYFYPSSPQKVKKYFTQEERALCIARTQRARNTVGERITLPGMLSIFRNAETYALWLAYFCVIWAVAGYGNFLPAIVKGLGYDAVESQLLTVPVNILGFLSVNFWSWYSDRIQLRGPLIILLSLTGAAGFAILAGVAHGTAPRLFALYLISFSVQPLVPLALAFLFTNTVGLLRKALAIPLQNACGQIGGLAVNFTFTDSPRYLRGTLGSVGCLVGLAVLVAVLDVYFKRENEKKEAARGSAQEGVDRVTSFDELGTAHPDFTYTL